MSDPTPSEEEKRRLYERFIDQANATPRREFSQGRISADDDGDLAIAMAVDHRNKTIIMRFGRPTEWIGLSAKDADALIDGLRKALFRLVTCEGMHETKHDGDI